jgi:hypothetical protein
MLAVRSIDPMKPMSKPGSRPVDSPLQALGYITNRRTASDPSRDIFSLRQCEGSQRAPTGWRNRRAATT